MIINVFMIDNDKIIMMMYDDDDDIKMYSSHERL